MTLAGRRITPRPPSSLVKSGDLGRAELSYAFNGKIFYVGMLEAILIAVFHEESLEVLRSEVPI